MTALIGALCHRLLDGADRDPQALAAWLGRIERRPETSRSIAVVPFDASFSAADVFASRESDESSIVVLVPAVRLSLLALKEELGPYSESPRLHPGSPRKLVFSPGEGERHPYIVRVTAEISADATEVESAAVQKLVATCSRAFAEEAFPDPATSERLPVQVWPRLMGVRAGFSVHSWREATLESVRDEIEAVLGVRFVPSHDKVYEGQLAFECTIPACELRLNSWPTDTPRLTLFNFIGTPSEDLDQILPRDEDISEALVSHLKSAGCDWYVPDRLELLGGVLGEGLLDRDVIVKILAPRWLAWCNADEIEAGVDLLRGVADMWLSAAQRTVDPLAELLRRRAEFEEWGRGVRPRGRIKILFAYAVQEQLSMIEEELFQLKELPAAERAASPTTSIRLAELRDVVMTLADTVKNTGLDSIFRQYQEVRASIDELA